MRGICLSRGLGDGSKWQEEDQPGKRQVMLAKALSSDKGGGKGGNDKNGVLSQLLVILTQLSVANAAELRTVTGSLFHTFLIPEDNPVAVALQELSLIQI